MNIQAQALSLGRPLRPPLNRSFHLISHHLARYSSFRTRGLRDSSLIGSSSWLGCPLSPLPSGVARRAASTSGASIAPVCKAPSINEDGFESQVLNSDCPVLVDFWATWCGPCKLVAPIMDWAAVEYAGTLKVFKIDIDSNPNLVEKFKVYGLPTLLLFKDGKEVPGSRREGAINKKKFKILLDELLSSVATT